MFTVRPDGGTDAESRAVAYLGRCGPAVSGQRGHDRTFEVARAVVYGFDLGPDVGFDLLQRHYNPRCQPPWSEADLRRKCDEADTRPFDKSRGYLLQGEAGAAASTAPALTGATPVGDEIEGLPMPQPEPWPALAPEALYGLASEVVRAIEPETESDPVAVLGQLLAAFGNAVGRTPYYPVEGDKHFPNLFLINVGKSAHGRKGTSWGRVRQAVEPSDPDWVARCVRSGLASGEGLLYCVRDPIAKRNEGGEFEVIDEGADDKRLLVVEGEFAQVLRVLKREGNTLSVFIRQAWDTGTLTSLPRNSPLKATGAHVSIIGYIMRQELGKYLDQTELFNGSADAVKPSFGDKPLAALTHADGEAYRQHMRDRGLRPATIHKRLGHVRQMLEDAVRLGHIATNTWRHVRQRQGDPSERRAYVSVADAQRVIDHCPNVWWRLLVALARFGGLRTPSEPFSLTWADVDWERGRLTVQSSKTRSRGKSHRVIPLFPLLRPHLEAAFEAAEEGAVYVFPDEYRQRASGPPRVGRGQLPHDPGQDRPPGRRGPVAAAVALAARLVRVRPGADLPAGDGDEVAGRHAFRRPAALRRSDRVGLRQGARMDPGRRRIRRTGGAKGGAARSRTGQHRLAVLDAKQSVAPGSATRCDALRDGAY